MSCTKQKLPFASDYMRGAHPDILKRLVETNMLSSTGYGQDEYTEAARQKIREACGCPGAGVEFLVGGTQTNATVIDAFLRSYQGVVAAETGHISVHEAGAIEASGHKVLTIPQKLGKISAEDVHDYVKAFYADESFEHMVMPGMVYLSHPTEYGTLYTREELAAFRKVCDEFHMALYVDGARLAYGLASPESRLTLTDLARYCDAFYIGGTKCGALFGEAVVVPDQAALPAFFTIIKQHGALLAKGRLLGLQYDVLFTDGLYERIGLPAIEAAQKITAALTEKGIPMLFETPTNQIFVIVENERLAALGEKVDYSRWEPYDEGHTVIRLATDWATTTEETQALIEAL